MSIHRPSRWFFLCGKSTCTRGRIVIRPYDTMDERDVGAIHESPVNRRSPRFAMLTTPLYAKGAFGAQEPPSDGDQARGKGHSAAKPPLFRKYGMGEVPRRGVDTSRKSAAY